MLYRQTEMRRQGTLEKSTAEFICAVKILRNLFSERTEKQVILMAGKNKPRQYTAEEVVSAGSEPDAETNHTVQL